MVYDSDQFSPTIWRTHKTVTHGAQPYAAIGIGEFHAKNLLDKFYKYTSVESAIFLAAFVIYQVKESVEGCGKRTSIWASRKGDDFHVSTSSTSDLERIFMQYPSAESDLFDYVFGGSATQDIWKGFGEKIEALRSGIPEIRSKIDALPRRRRRG